MDRDPDTTTFMKAALISAALGSSVPQLVVLQYDPAQLRRRFTPDYLRPDGASARKTPLAAPPIEMISMTARITVIDQRPSNDAATIDDNIQPQLTALGMMMFPDPAAVNAATAQMAEGVLEIVPLEPPLSILVLGQECALPVQLISYAVTDMAYDALLNPTDAEVALDMKVMRDNDFSLEQSGLYDRRADIARRALM